MAANERNRNNVRAGLFVVFSLLGALAVAVFLSDGVSSILRSQTEYAAVFNVSGGVNNLQPGGKVRLGGVVVGNVASVRLVQVDDTTRAKLAGSEDGSAVGVDVPPDTVAVEVRFEVDSDYALFDNALVAISSPLVGSDVWLDITSLGGPAGSSQVATVDHPLVVRTASGLAGQLLGADGAASVASIVEGVDSVVGDVEAMLADLRSIRRLDDGRFARVRGANQPAVPLADGESMDALVQQIVSLLWSTDRTVQNVRLISDVLVDPDAPEIVARFGGDQLVAAAEAEAAEARAEGRTPGAAPAPVGNVADLVRAAFRSVHSVRSTLGNIEEPVRMFAEVDYPAWSWRIDGTLAWVDAIGVPGMEMVSFARDLMRRSGRWLEQNEGDLTRTLASARDATDQVSSLLADSRPDLDASIVNVRLATQQAGLMIEELRRNPWRVLYSPDDRELDNELLYEAARGLAVAAERLESATSRADRLLEASDRATNDAAGTIDPDTAARIRETLGAPLRNYGEAQQRLLDILKQRTASAAP